jgi:glycosyltransferase involved in cell wall biosynthesis
LPGFRRAGFDSTADVRLEYADDLPFDDGTVQEIAVDRFLETLPRGEAAAFLRECRRVLTADGVVRLTPSVGTQPADGAVPDADRHQYDAAAIADLAVVVGLEEDLTLRPPSRRGKGGAPAGGGPGLLLRRRRPAALGAEPLVSVLIAAYKPRFFRAALQSAVDQTFRHLEILIGDDCPTGAIREIVAEFAADPRIRYYRNEGEAGVRANYLGLFERASGPYVKFLNDDDLLHPTCVQRMAACLDAFPDVTLVTSHRHTIDAGGEVHNDARWTDALAEGDVLIGGRALCDLMIAHEANAIGEPTTAMFRKADLDGVRPHIFSLDGTAIWGPCDVLMWLNLLGRGDAIFLADRLSSFRIHPDQDTHSAVFKRNSEGFWPNVRRHGTAMGFFLRGTLHPLRRRLLRDLSTRLPDAHVPGPVAFAVDRWIGAVRRATVHPGVDAAPRPDEAAVIVQASRLRSGGSEEGLQSAYDLLCAALAQRRESDALRVAVADLLLDAQEPVAARDVLAGGLADPPRNAGLYLRLGVAALRLHRQEEAHDAFAIAQTLAPGTPGPEIGLTAVRMLQTVPAEANR